MPIFERKTLFFFGDYRNLPETELQSPGPDNRSLHQILPDLWDFGSLVRFPGMAEHKSSKIIPFRKVKSYSNLLFIKKRFCFFPDSFLKKHPANKINRTQTKPSFPSVDMAAASPSTSPIKHTNKGLRIHCTSYYIIYSSSVSILIAIFSCTSSSFSSTIFLSLKE